MSPLVRARRASAAPIPISARARGVLAAALAALLLLALGTASAQARLVMFSAPSHNIGCAIDNGFARCDVARHTWKAPAKPTSCRLDWGNGMAVGRRGRGAFVCAGDTTLNPRGAVLPYGRSRSVGSFTCSSRRSGMTCRNGANGHGFTVSRTVARAF
ncbi:DUF6636 domain-containing protein [Conexibacter sp. CPCC 206217]|uniref:DUF6636 domain-containing protein n=1 Tax=Conexibacter sp. CPCC 206217 TaxID=3064574 RepID=UPI00271FAAC3|nr:DUF6636 domain-containing protein [Conexibacter sp. CPCC 206217]MDO8211786.1 hypothetical protein [Conexibacter sp. CPCC 206217]